MPNGLDRFSKYGCHWLSSDRVIGRRLSEYTLLPHDHRRCFRPEAMCNTPNAWGLKKSCNARSRPKSWLNRLTACMASKELPPRTKKLSCMLIWLSGIPRTSDQIWESCLSTGFAGLHKVSEAEVWASAQHPVFRWH